MTRAIQAALDWAATRFRRPSEAKAYFEALANNLAKDHPHRAEVYAKAAEYCNPTITAHPTNGMWLVWDEVDG